MKICLLGASNPEIIRVLSALRHAGQPVDVVGFIDNDKSKWGNSFWGYPVLGGTDVVSKLTDDDVSFLNLITGSTLSRHETSREILKHGGRLANLIHPNVDQTMTKVGVGNYIQEAVVLQAKVIVGDNCSIHMGAKIGHETTIGTSTFIAHEVSVSGCCQIGSGVFIGTNATLIPRLTIGDGATIGAGAVVTNDIPAGAVAVGNPARIIKIRESSASFDFSLDL